jgi:hypothetical protein
MLKNLLKSPHTLDVEERRAVTRSAGILAGAAVAVIVALACITAGNVVSADSPFWDAILQTRLALVRLVLASAVLVISYYATLVEFHAFSHTALGRSIIVWKADDTDGANMHGFKTSNAGFIIALMFAGNTAGLLLSVLR